MAKCAICEKAAHFGNNVSHSHRRSNKMWKSNVKSVKIKTAEGGARMLYFLVYFTDKYQMERRSHEFGTYVMLGMKKRSLFQ